MLLDAEKWDAVVVGAGPGGSSAAFHCAAAGLRVLLLERRSFPRDKSCGDGITRAGIRILEEMGVLPLLTDGRRFSGIRIHMAGKGHRDFRHGSAAGDPNGYGMVVKRLVLDHALCRRAVETGAVLREEVRATRLLTRNGTVVGVEVREKGDKPLQIYSRVVIAADGANSALARQLGLRSGPEQGVGEAVRAYFDDVEGLEDLLEFYMLLTDSSDRYLLPSYGWVFPVGPRSANVGVGLFELDRKVNIRDLFRSFLDQLAYEDPRFARAQQRGPFLGAPLRTDFAPSRCGAPGLLLVGDAAGMVSPFTGEGISFALEAGRLAGEASVRWIRDHSAGSIDPSDYKLVLEQSYAGYFETGRWSTRRYRLIWHVLQAGFDSDRPIHRVSRRLILAPEGIGEPTAGTMLPDLGPMVPQLSPQVRSGLLEVGKVLTSVVRQDWPFLARLSLSDLRPETNVPFRPSLLVLLCGSLVEGDVSLMPHVGAAVELGYLSFLAQGGVEEATGKAGDPANWGNKFCVLLSDFLLSKAYEEAGRAGTRILQRLTDAVTKAVKGRVREAANVGNVRLTEQEVLDNLRLSAGSLGELPCALGAEVAGASPALVQVVSHYGSCLAMAHAIVDDVLNFQDDPDLASQVSPFSLRSGVYGLVVARGVRTKVIQERELENILSSRKTSLEKLVLRIRQSDLLESTMGTAREYADEARSALAPLRSSSVRLTLERLADYAVSRQTTAKAPRTE